MASINIASVEFPRPNKIDRLVHNNRDRNTEISNLSLRYCLVCFNSWQTLFVQLGWKKIEIRFFFYFSRMTMAWSHRRRLHWLKPKWWSKVTSSTLFYIFVKNKFSRFLILSLGNIHHIHLLQFFYYVDAFVVLVAYAELLFIMI